MKPGSGRRIDRLRRKRWVAGLLLAGAAIGAPALALALLRRRAEPPPAPRWGRAHRYSGKLGEIVFQQLGSGAPVILLHSLGPGYDAEQWRAAAELLAARFTVYVPDLPGWGRSQGPAGSYEPGLFVGTLGDFIEGVVGGSAALVAAGQAAAFATALAVEAPELVRALALVGPLGLGRGEQAVRPFVARLLGIPVVSATVLDVLTARTALEHHLRRDVYAAPEKVDAALLDHHYRASHRPEARRALAAYWTGDLALDVREAVRELDRPLWLAWGRAARRPPVATADLWLHHLPEELEADLEVFEGCGDQPHAENPAAFARALERFLAAVPDRPD
jgi:pimeloyl-ACP methyl ester carboxylesterase